MCVCGCVRMCVFLLREHSQTHSDSVTIVMFAGRTRGAMTSARAKPAVLRERRVPLHRTVQALRLGLVTCRIQDKRKLITILYYYCVVIIIVLYSDRGRGIRIILP
uniref:Uncharacterized protein n=1 Tax=Schizaphis graminum TaxID=13262 RepID=A0A2S2NQE9_SCHGA